MRVNPTAISRRRICADLMRSHFDLESILICWLWVRPWYAHVVCFALPLRLYCVITPFSSERWPAALVLRVLKKKRRRLALKLKVYSLWRSCTVLRSWPNRYQRPWRVGDRAFPPAFTFIRSRWERVIAGISNSTLKVWISLFSAMSLRSGENLQSLGTQCRG